MVQLEQSIQEITNRIRTEVEKISNGEKLEQFRIEFLGRKGKIAALFDELKSVSVEQKPIIGKKLNELRIHAENIFQKLQTTFQTSQKEKEEFIDVTLPGRTPQLGKRHILTQTIDEIKRIFISMGFDVAYGPEIEDDEHNFEALNFPPNHPARDMQDTFFLAEKILLRTHTSPVQIRVMKNQSPPVRVIIPGRVYRNEAISARSYCLFNQVEGLYIDKNVSLSELKGTLVAFAKQFYGNSLQYRFRASYFPFTEPSVEMDITCFLCKGKGCRVCKQSGWLEILGAGMVHPNVLKNCGYNPEEVQGYAFGMGVDRITMLRYGITDIRLLYENDVRFLKQF
mgnify:CR=1 FL=1